MLHQFDHRWATYDGGDIRDASEAAKRGPCDVVVPRYWVHKRELDAHIAGWTNPWIAGFRGIGRNTDERTMIASIAPRAGAGNSLPILLFAAETPLVAAAIASLSSFCHDYTARQKAGGVNLNFFIVEQLPLPAPRAFDGDALDFIVPRVLELTYTATDLAGFAAQLGHDGPPFRWDPSRRVLIRAELDALMFRLYGVDRDDAGYIMETFPIVKRRDEEQYCEYRTKRLILERYDALIAAEATGMAYVTPLNPSPGDPRVAVPITVTGDRPSVRGSAP